MSWNYRVVDHNGCFEIREAYYDMDGNVDGWSALPIAAAGSDLEELKKDLEHMMRALTKPVLLLTDLEEAFPDDQAEDDQEAEVH